VRTAPKDAAIVKIRNIKVVNLIRVDFGSFHVMQMLHMTFNLHSRLPTSWEPHAVGPGGSAYVLHAQGHGIAFTRATWGRSGVDADRRHIDTASPALVPRGIIFASSVNMTAPNAAQPWNSKTFRIGMPGAKFIMLGCRLDPGPSGPEFALLGATAGTRWVRHRGGRARRKSFWWSTPTHRDRARARG